MKHNNKNILFVLCIENKDCDDLEKRKVYQVLPDDKAADEGYLRIYAKALTLNPTEADMPLNA